MHASEVTAEVIERANELYWTTDRSVNGIADELDLSKGALYGAIAHLPSGMGCPLCGDEVGYPNRTARDRKQLDCQTCDWDGSPDETVGYVAEDSDPEEVARRERTPPDRRDEAQSSPAPIDDDGTGVEPLPPRPLVLPPLDTIAKGALIGGAVGLALVLLARRR